MDEEYDEYDEDNELEYWYVIQLNYDWETECEMEKRAADNDDLLYEMS